MEKPRAWTWEFLRKSQEKARRDGGMCNDLAAWLAVNVMGWRLGKAEAFGMTFPSWFRDGKLFASPWDPLRYDAQAMMVLDRMVGLGWEFGLWSLLGRVTVNFWKPDCDLEETARERASRLAAICHASKAAIEAERAAKTTTCGYCGSVVE